MKQNAVIQKLTLIYDLLRLSRLTGSLSDAYRYLKRDHPLNEIKGVYRGLDFHARRGDWPALREVLLNDEYGCLEELFTPEDAPKILDLGAHIGCFALRVFSYNKNAQILSVEAAQDTAEFLEKNQQCNTAFNWKILRGAVWKDETPVYLDRAKSSLGHRVGRVETEDKVDGLTPDAILNKAGWDQIDFVKMDIEGAEGEVIPVSANIIEKTRYFLIEIHNDRISNGQAIFSDLKNSFNYAYRMGDRFSEKPVFLFSKDEIRALKGWKQA